MRSWTDRISPFLTEIRNVANKGLFHLFTANGMVFIVGFASQLFVAGLLLPEDIGRIKIMQTYINLATVIGGLGFNTSLIKLASEKISPKQKHRLFNIALILALACSFLLYLILLLLNQWGLVSSDDVIQDVFPLYAIFLMPLVIQSMYLAFFQANQRIRTMARLQVIIKIISVLAIFILTWLFTLRGYVWAVVLTAIAGILVLELNTIPRLTHRWSSGFNKTELKKMWHLASFALAANVVGTIAITIDVYYINYLIEDRVAVGYYMFALTLVSIYKIIPTSIQQIALPFFSVKSENYTYWYNSYRKYNLLNHYLIVGVTVLGALLVPVFLSLVFGSKYDGSIKYFMLISAGWAIRNSNMIKGTALMGQGRFNLNFLVSLMLLFISAPILWIIIYYYGMEGAGFSHIILGIVSYILAGIVFRRFNRKSIYFGGI